MSPENIDVVTPKKTKLSNTILLFAAFFFVAATSVFVGIKIGERRVYGEILRAMAEPETFSEDYESMIQPTEEITPEPTQAEELTQVEDKNITPNWKTYTNKAKNYTIKYPTGWAINTTRADMPDSDPLGSELVISKDSYKITVLWPTAFGPSICLFDDQSRKGAPDMASYCEGKYVDIKQDGGKILSRRLESPRFTDDAAIWSLYRKDQYGNFVGVPPTTYESPVKYSPEEIKQMDEIVGSMSYTDSK